MELSGVVNSTLTQLSNAQPGKDDIGVSVLKDSLEIQKQTSEQLLSSVPKPASPDHLGNNIDVHA